MSSEWGWKFKRVGFDAITFCIYKENASNACLSLLGLGNNGMHTASAAVTCVGMQPEPSRINQQPSCMPSLLA